MRLVGQLGRIRVAILVDTGSTHNFEDTNMASRCNLVLQLQQSLQVKVANCQVLETKSMYAEVPPFLVDFFTLSLQGYDAVLGV